jgi:adenylate cyclase
MTVSHWQHPYHSGTRVRRSAGREAEASFRQAIEIARRQHARTLELRATTSLARLLAAQAKRRDARALLSRAVAGFVEGFDTADLVDAKTVLDELAG